MLQKLSLARYTSCWDSVRKTERNLAEISETNAEIGRLLKEQSVKFDRDMKESSEKFDREKKESSAKFDQEMKESSAKFDRLMEISNANFEKSKNDFDRRMKELQKQIGGISNSNGDYAEDFFFFTLKRDKIFANQQFDKIRRNLMYDEDYDTSPDDDTGMECDILLFNGTSAALIEVKYNAKSSNLNINKLISRAQKFKRIFPEYSEHQLFLGVAAFAFENKMAKKLRSAGIATIHQIGKKMVMYDKALKAF
jgi:hypothetical protein